MNRSKTNFGLLLLTAFAFVACKDEVKKEAEPELISGVITANMDTSVNPGDNFTAYVNGTWMKNTEIPADKSSYGVGYMVHEESEDNVKKIIEAAAAGTNAEGSDEQKVGDLYGSFMNMDKRNEIGMIPLQAEFAKIDEIASYDDLATYFGYANKYGYSVPMSLFFYQDFKNPEIYTTYLMQSGLGLPDREYYLKTDERSKEIQLKYSQHIGKMFSIAGLNSSMATSKVVMDLETKFAEKHLEKEKTRDLVALYNMVAKDKLSELKPNFNWDNYLTELGINSQENIGVLTIEYLKGLDPIIKSTSLENWKIYLKWGAISGNAYLMNKMMDDQNFNFYTKELRGTPEQRPMWRRGVGVVNDKLGEVVGKVYVKEHFPPEAKERMETLVANLLKAYESSIKELDWMSEETKVQALDKLSKFTPKIGYPDNWRDYSSLSISKDDLFGNM